MITRRLFGKFMAGSWLLGGLKTAAGRAEPKETVVCTLTFYDLRRGFITKIIVPMEVGEQDGQTIAIGNGSGEVLRAGHAYFAIAEVPGYHAMPYMVGTAYQHPHDIVFSSVDWTDGDQININDFYMELYRKEKT